MKHYVLVLLCLLALLNTAFGNAKQSALNQDDSLLIPADQIILALLHKLSAPEDSRSLVQLLTADSLKENHTTHSQPIVIGSEVVSWDKVYLWPIWKSPVATAHRVNHVIQKNDISEGDNYLFYAETKQTQEELKFDTYGILAFFSFILFWHTRSKIKEGVPQFGWKNISLYLLLLGYLNLITIFPWEPSILVALLTGPLFAYMTGAKRNNDYDCGFWDNLCEMMPADVERYILRTILFWIPAGYIIFQLHLSEASFSYLQFNLMLVSSIVYGNLLALMMLTTWTLLTNMVKALFARKKVSA